MFLQYIPKVIRSKNKILFILRILYVEETRIFLFDMSKELGVYNFLGGNGKKVHSREHKVVLLIRLYTQRRQQFLLDCCRIHFPIICVKYCYC